MLFSKREKIIKKNVSVLKKGMGVLDKPYKIKELQTFLRTNYYILFIPIFTYDKIW